MKTFANIKNKLGLWALVGALFTGPALAETADTSVIQTTDKMQLQWHEWDKFRDINEGRHDTATKFRERVFQQLGDTIAENAAQLPEGYILQMLVIDLDLAGDTSAQTRAGMSGVRVYNRGFAPAMSFKFAVLDAQQKVVIDGAESIYNRNYLSSRAASSFRTDSLAYDKEIINSWFRDTLLPEVEKRAAK